MSPAENTVVAVIMAGGAGTRFWPLSTQRRPKQFLRLFGERSLLQMSYDRLIGVVPPERVLVLTNADFVGLVAEQLPELPAANIVGEPHRRDTAAAVTLAALLVEKRFGPCVIATLTADHLIEPVELFQRTLVSATKAAAGRELLYTFGIRPTYPATGYGYLELGDETLEDGAIHHFKLARFKEKPDAATAEGYVASGRYLWNSGMFVWSTGAILAELRRQLPEHIGALSRAVAADGTGSWAASLEGAFRGLKPVSIDFGVMEHAAEVRCVASTFSWSDVGGWLALADHLPQDDESNHYRGNLLTLDAHDNLVFCEDSKEAVVLVGVENLVVVRSGGRTLIMTKERTEEIKQLVKKHNLE